MKPITNYKRQEQDYRKKMSAYNVSYRLKRSGPKVTNYILRGTYINYILVQNSCNIVILCILITVGPPGHGP